MPLRDHTFLGMTQSLCPECLALLPAKIVVKGGGRVYFRKRCPTHGTREDFVCSDVSWYDRTEFSVPGRLPATFGTSPDKGCPFDCGLCTEHEQHTCLGLVELTSSCNLRCPMCYASSGPGGTHLSFAEVTAAIDRLVEAEGRAEVLQLSGGEPTLHPEFARIVEYACDQAIDWVLVNTNGLRIARDPELLDVLAKHRHRLEVYLQFDGFTPAGSLALRGEDLVALKLKAVERLGEAGVNVTLVATLQPGVNAGELGELVRFGLDRPWVTGLSLQPATYSGRHVLPEELERRVTFPDVVRGLVEQTGGLFQPDDFLPLPCAHPNCHIISYVYRKGDIRLPLARFIDAKHHPELLANGITFTRPQLRQLLEQYLGAQACCGPGGCGTDEGLVQLGGSPPPAAGHDFFARALVEDLGARDVFRVTITSFLDAYNFDVRRVMKCCTHHILPSGHVIPFCAYNVLYREGHVPMPTLDLLQVGVR
jgi:uncharacterized radical SAM superfamily Fe-S cluster-containing enzyme